MAGPAKGNDQLPPKGWLTYIDHGGELSRDEYRAFKESGVEPPMQKKAPASAKPRHQWPTDKPR